MTSQTISVNEAALLVKKSPQTIRRLIKGNTIKYRRKHTPQGFLYHIERQSLLDYFFSPEDKKTASVCLPRVSRPIKEKPQEIKITPEEENGVYDLDFKKSAEEAREDIVVEPFDELLEEKKEDAASEFELLPQEEVVASKKDASQQASQAQKDTGQQPSIQQTSKQNDSFSQQASQVQTVEDNTKFILNYFNDTLQQIVKQHERVIRQYEEDKRNLFNLVETFQQRIVNLEHHIRQLEAPKKKWWQFWK